MSKVWVVAPFYPYDGYGQPEHAFQSWNDAEAWKAEDRECREEYEIFALDVRESPRNEGAQTLSRDNLTTKGEG